MAGQSVFVVPHGARQVHHDAAYWHGGARHQLYDVPDRNQVALWTSVHAVQPSGNRVRVLKSRNIKGYILFYQQADRTSRIGDWQYIHELLMLNPVNYFLAHPQVDAIYVETTDTDQYTQSSGQSDPSAMVTVGDALSSGSGHSLDSHSTASARTDDTDSDPAPNYALVLHRSEYTYEVAVAIREMQSNFFINNRSSFPPARSFTNTLHGR